MIDPLILFAWTYLHGMLIICSISMNASKYNADQTPTTTVVGPQKRLRQLQSIIFYLLHISISFYISIPVLNFGKNQSKKKSATSKNLSTQMCADRKLCFLIKFFFIKTEAILVFAAVHFFSLLVVSFVNISRSH